MRFLHSIHSVDPALGGPIEFLRQLIPIHAQLGHELIVTSMDDPNAACVKDFPGKIHAFGPSSAYGYTPDYLPWLKREHGRFDAIFVHGLWQFIGLATWLALRGTKTPYLVFPHGMLDPWFKQAYPTKHFKKSVYWHLFEHRILRSARSIIFTADEERIAAQKTFNLRDCCQVVIGLGIGNPPGDGQFQQELFLKQYPHLTGQRIILFLSRIHPKKGCDLLLEAFTKVLSEDIDAHLLMAGPSDNGYAENLAKHYVLSSKELAGRVTWTGLITGDLKWGALRLADALILPSHQENFGMVVVESLACGTPVLVSNKVNIWRDLVDAGAGFVESDDLPGTARLLRQWLTLPALEQNKMRLNAKRTFERQFAITEVCRKLISLLEATVAPDRAR
jgi:glycosyltransferase involved in cell wall biosynthesis